MSRRHRRGSSGSESPGAHRRKRTSDVRIAYAREVRESSAAMQRRESTKAAKPTKPIEAHRAKPSAISAPPWEEAVTGPNRQPTEAAPPKSETESTSESKK